MNTISQKSLINQAKSKKSYLLACWISLSSERKAFIQLLLNQEKKYGSCSLSEHVLANKVGVTRTTISTWKKELKYLSLFKLSIPQRRENSYKHFTTKIKALFNIKSFLSEYFTQRTKVLRDSYINYKSLYINTPLSPKGETGEYKNKQKEEKYTLIHTFARKHRLHYKDQTLKLFIFPLHILRKGFDLYAIAYEESLKERSYIRRPFKYVLKILQCEMAKAGLKLLWGIYYKMTAKVSSFVEKKVIKAHHPVPRAPLPAPTAPREPFSLEKHNQLLQQLEGYDIDISIKEALREYLNRVAAV